MGSRQPLLLLAFPAAMASWLACGGEDLVTPTPGELVVTVSTSGEDTDTDGYAITLDGQPAASIEPNGTHSFTVAEGDHTVELSGVAANCSAAAGLTQDIRVIGNQDNPVAFDIVCVTTAGGLQVTAVTTGPQEDADGYGVRVDGGEAQPTGVNASLTFTGLPAGDHSVELESVAENCTVGGENPRTVTVIAGQMVETRFDVTCVATLGGIAVATSTTGPGTDDDGYAVKVDDGPEQPVGLNGSVVFTGLAAGTHNVTLDGVAANCTVEGENPRAVEVPVGDPVTVDFRVSCASGVSQWTTMNSGTNADLPDVWGTSASDMFVVGELPLDANDRVSSVILHFDGAAWTPQLTQTDLMLRGVWGSAADDVYAVGSDDGGDARVLRFDGARWSDVPGLTVQAGEQTELLSIWGSSESEIFAVGSTFNGVELGTLVFHYDGTRWQRMTVNSEFNPPLADVWGSSPTDVYAVGRVPGARIGVILHYDGTAWSSVFELDELALNAVWGTAEDNVYAAGFRVDRNLRAIGVILHFDGTDWSEVEIPPSEVINELWASAADDVFAVGNGGTVLHFDGSGWTSTNPTTPDLLGIWGLSSSDVFAVGAAGTILRGTP
jgi:hypothetical protein